jgi:hypothetical protein
MGFHRKCNEVGIIGVPYRVPFYPNIVGAHLLASRPAGGVMKYLSQMFHEELQSYVFTSLLSRVLESAILPAQGDLLLQGLNLMGQPMSGHVDSCQNLFLQDVDLVGQGSHLRDFKWSRLFTPCSLELGESANKGREAGLMVFTIKSCPIPSPQRYFHRKIKEASTRAGLKTYAPNNLSVSGTRLIL